LGLGQIISTLSLPAYHIAMGHPQSSIGDPSADDTIREAIKFQHGILAATT
jgi:hypothetical protein